MEIEESTKQFSLQENRPQCIQLDYEEIISHLIPAGVISQQENAQPPAEFEDNAARMREFMSKPINIHAEASIETFRGAAKQVGDISLGEKHLRDHSSFGIPLNTGNAHTCLFNIDVLDKLFSFLGQPDLSIARLVCQTWNSVITTWHTKKFEARFQADSGHKQMIEFMSTGLKSSFCRRLTSFTLDVRTIPRCEWVIYKKFFVEFGPKIQSLELGPNLAKVVLATIFLSEIQPYLCNLKYLDMAQSPDKGILSKDSFIFLSGLEALHIACRSSEEREYFRQNISQQP